MTKKDTLPVPPVAAKIPFVHLKHEDERHDPYYWLREREDPEVLRYLEEENEYTDRVLQPVEQLKEELFQEIKGRIKEDDASVPYLRNGFEYYYRYETGKEYPIYCRKEKGGDEEILIDANEAAGASGYYAVGGRAVSEDNRLLAYGEDRIGRRLYTLRFKDLSTGAYFPEEIHNTTGTAVWADDHKTIFYTLKDVETLRACKVMRHTLGSPVSDDVEVFEEVDDTFFSGVYKTRTRSYIMIYSVSTLTTEFRFLPADQPLADFRLVRRRQRGVEYEPEHHGKYFYIKTNEGGAVNFQLMRVPVETSAAEKWETVVPHRASILLEDCMALEDYLILQERVKGITELRVLPLSDLKDSWYIPFDEASHGVWFGPNHEFGANTLRFIYTSMTTPQSVYDIDLKSQERQLLKESPVLGGFNKDDYASERVWVKSLDGVEVPMSIVYRKGFRKDGQHPVLLYGYGSYGHSTDPYFSSPRLSLLDRGFAFAIAHVRGGEEMGRPWYEDGKLFKKKNTFNDFIACGEYLIENGYTSSKQLYAMGGSAGGLLMGAIINMRPDLWNGIVAAVPFVDVVTTMLDDSIPLTTFEYDEWGNPNEAEAYNYMKSYSPYDNVSEVEYPHMLVTTGLHDSQVQYWEPAKWVAKMRQVKTGDNWLLLHTNMEAGHGGASGRFQQYREVARNYAFLLWLSNGAQ